MVLLILLIDCKTDIEPNVIGLRFIIPEGNFVILLVLYFLSGSRFLCMQVFPDSKNYESRNTLRHILFHNGVSH